jgi:TolB-like protein/Flp pilus assembly protein TadD
MRTPLLPVLAGLLLIAAGGAAWWLYRPTGAATDASPASPHATTQPYIPPDVGLSKAPRLSIVVLPFENLSGDPKDNYVAEGVTEDVTTDLSRVHGMFVIARESAYAYQGKSIDVRKVGEELGVRYVLEGSVRKVGDALRVNAQLISTETGAHLWADRFDQQLSDLSAGQEEIVRRVGQILNIALADIEIARSKRERPTNLDAFDLILRARSLSLHPMGEKEHAERRALLEQALRLDPNSIYAMTQLAFEIDREQVFGNAKGDDLARATKLVADAAAISPNHINVLFETAHLLFTEGRHSEAVATLQRLLNEYPNACWAYYNIGSALIPLGRANEAIQMIKSTLRCDPLSGWNYDRFASLGWALLLDGQDEEASVWLQRALAAGPTVYPVVRANIGIKLAAAYARLGHRDEAHAALTAANRVWPYDTVRSHSPGWPSNPIYAAQIERYQEALRLAGQRDHADEDADFHVPADGNLRTTLAGLTPTTVPSATTIRTAEIRKLLDDRNPIVIDPLLYSWGRSIAGAIGLNNSGRGGSLSDAMQDRLRKKMQQLTKGDLATPIVAVGWNSERFDGRNLTLPLVALGYTNVHWYRGGREAWEVAGLPETKVDVQDW